MEGDKLISNITKDLKLGSKNKKDSKSQSQFNDPKFVYLDKTKIEENENNIPLNASTNMSSSLNFTDVLKSFDLPSIINETDQTKFKKNLKNYVKNKETSKVQIKFEDTEGRVIERTKNYDSMVKEVTKYQAKVKINKEADVLDFTTNHQNLSFTAKSLINNSSNKDLNVLEKSIKDILIKNKYS